MSRRSVPVTSLPQDRRLEDFEFAPLLPFGVVLAAIAGLAFWTPRAFAWPLAAPTGWISVSFIVEAAVLWRHRRIS